LAGFRHTGTLLASAFYSLALRARDTTIDMTITPHSMFRNNMVLQRDIPFYFVQLAPWAYGGADPLPLRWEQQEACLDAPNLYDKEGLPARPFRTDN
jgi:hypothetical protein